MSRSSWAWRRRERWSSGRPSRMLRSLTRSLLQVQFLHERLHDGRPGDDDVRPFGVEARHLAALFQAERTQMFHHALELFEAQHVLAGLAGEEPGRDIRQVHDRTGASDGQVRLVPADPLEDVYRRVADVPLDVLERAPRDRAGLPRLQEHRLQPDRPQPQRVQVAVTALVADDHLRAAAAHVEEDGLTTRQVHTGRHPQPDQAGLLLAGDHVDIEAGLAFEAGQELAAVAGLAGGRGRHRDDLPRAKDRAIRAKRLQTWMARSTAAGRRRWRVNSPSPRRTVSFCCVSVLYVWFGWIRASSRRMEFVPMSMKATTGLVRLATRDAIGYPTSGQIPFRTGGPCPAPARVPR